MPPETETPKTDEDGTTNGEAVSVAESVPESAQNEPKTVESPTGESGQLGGIDPIVSVETSTGEAKPDETITAQAESVASASAPSSQAVTPEPRSGENTAGVIIPPVVVVVSPEENKKSFALSLLAQAREKLQFRKRKKLDRILAEITKKGKITNDEVEKLLHISDKTAERYLSQLVKEQKIKTNGKKGKAIEYLAN
ncbi:MAG: winged helix-turn-helix transcriptional regulator [Candidatus Gracilibacteria bacterium]|jgi:predicted HTH transcriptional regulator